MTSLANALDPSSRAASADGPKQAMPRGPHRVGDPRDQRPLGPDDDQVDAQVGGQRGRAAGIGHVERRRRHLRGDAGVARRARRPR